MNVDPDDETPELIGIIVGAAIGAAPWVIGWYTHGRFESYHYLAFGFPAALMAIPTSLVGAVIGFFSARTIKRSLRQR